MPTTLFPNLKRIHLLDDQIGLAQIDYIWWSKYWTFLFYTFKIFYLMIKNLRGSTSNGFSGAQRSFKRRRIKFRIFAALLVSTEVLHLSECKIVQWNYFTCEHVIPAVPIESSVCLPATLRAIWKVIYLIPLLHFGAKKIKKEIATTTRPCKSLRYQQSGFFSLGIVLSNKFLW